MNSPKQVLWIEAKSDQFRSFKQLMKCCSSDQSKIGYAYKFQKFIKFCISEKILKDMDDFDELLKLTPDAITDLLIDYIDYQREKGDRYSTVNTAIVVPIAFFDMNRRNFHKKEVTRSNTKEDVLPSGQVPSTDADVGAMIAFTYNLRNKAVLHFIASTGIRPRALVDPVLRWKHLTSLPDISDLYGDFSENPNFIHNPKLKYQRHCYAVKVYDQSKEGYFAFLTPEASDALDKYHKQRKNAGEIFNDETPLFTNQSEHNFTKYEYLTDDSLRHMLRSLIKGARIERNKVGKHYDKAMVYMFRKRFNGHLKMLNDVNSNIAEKLMAHKRGLDGTYLQPTMEQCYIEFFKAIPRLTIDPHNRHQLELEHQQKIIETLREEKQRHVEEMRSNFIKWFKEMKPRQIEKIMGRKIEILNS